jgi:hypothetical protein
MPLSSLTVRRLTALSNRLGRILSLESISAKRSVDGTFTKATTLTPQALRAAWSATGKRAPATVRPDFKSSLRAALKLPRQ